MAKKKNNFRLSEPPANPSKKDLGRTGYNQPSYNDVGGQQLQQWRIIDLPTPEVKRSKKQTNAMDRLWQQDSFDSSVRIPKSKLNKYHTTRGRLI